MEEVEFNILIIGDNSENIQKGAKILKNNNIDVSIITTGKNIVKKVEKNTYDLILLDIMFPEINGFSICKYLKNDYRTKDIPIIFLTENNDIDTIVVFAVSSHKMDQIMSKLKINNIGFVNYGGDFVWKR